MSETPRQEPGLALSLVPVGVLILLLAASVYLFGDGSSAGPNQIALILSAAVGSVLGLRLGYSWGELQDGMVHGVGLAMGAIFILLIVGALIGTWITAGIVQTMIYYGLKLLHPSVFYLASCIICAVVALATGSSWTTAGTLGIALVGIAGALDLDVGITAGAIISGAYFGDKLSPLSDTTNLAPAMAGTDLFLHIRHMLWTTVPALALGSAGFLALGLGNSTDREVDLSAYLTALDSNFNISWVLLVPPAIVLFMVARKVPAFPALLIGALAGGIFGTIFQQEAILKFVASPELPPWAGLIKGVWIALFDGFTSSTGNEGLDELLTRGGMSSMLSTVWLIVSAMMFGAVMERTGMLKRLAATILGSVKSNGSLIAATLGTSLGANVIASDQYMAIVLPGRMYRAEFIRRGLDTRNLSRALEDSGTMTSPLVPWNTCGAFMAGTLGVATLTYLPFCFVNLLSPLISALYGFTGFTIRRAEAEPEGGLAPAPAD